MRPSLINLAAEPFVNERPVRRTSLLLWLVGGLLLILNVILYPRPLSGQVERSTAIESIEERRAEVLSEIATLQSELASLDLNHQNMQIEFLNTQIAKRTFSWSGLIDRLAEALPTAVQLRRVTPKASDPRDARFSRAGVDPERSISVEIVGESRSSDSVLEFVDALFEHPSFVSPNLMSESPRNDGMNQFSLSMLYLPHAQSEIGE